jgi:hypothetical protein
MHDLPCLSLSPDGFAFSPSSGDTFTVNQSGMIILRSLQTSGDQDDATRRLMETCRIPREQAQRDVADFHDRLRSLGLI